MVTAQPVLHGLRVRFPKARISWLINPSLAPIVQHHPDLDEVILFDRRALSKVGLRWSATRGLFRLIGELRRRRFDLVLDLQGLLRSGFLAGSTGAPVRAGFADPREAAARIFYTHRVSGAEPDMHAVDRNYLFGRMLGFDDVPPQFNLAITDRERQQAADALESAGIAIGQPFAAVLPGARWETKEWIVGRFAEMIDELAATRGVRSVLLGETAERLRCDRILELARSEPANLCSQTNLRVLMAILERANVAVCHDSGPMHLAAALGRPLVCVTGPTNPSRTGPYGRLDAVVSAGVPCSPCYLRRLRQCQHNHDCMKNVSVAQVVAAVHKELDRPSASADMTRASSVRVKHP